MSKPYVIGLTGGIGTGKSVVRQTLVRLGAEGIDADRVGHEVMAPDGAAYGRVVAEFGSAILDGAGQIDRGKLGPLVFGDAAALARLEAIVHPAVADVVAQRIAASSAPMVVVEAIKLFEAGLSRTLCDEVWVTVARPGQQAARLKADRGMDADEVARRMDAQMQPAEMAAQAQHVIDTSGMIAETHLQALAGWADLDLPLPPAEIRLGTHDDAEGIGAVLNSVVREGGLTVIDRTYTLEEEQAYLRELPARALLLVATVAGIIVGCQDTEPYARYTGAMDHVATMGTFIARGVRGRGIGRALAAAMFVALRANDFTKVVINVRADNPGAQAFYTGLGFRPCGRLAKQAYIDGRYVDELLFELFLEA